VTVVDTSERLPDDARQAWIYGLNCYTDRDLSELAPENREQQMAYRQRRVAIYAKRVLIELDADVDRLQAAGEHCRNRYAQCLAQGADPRGRAGGYARGAELVDAAIEMIRQARADVRPAARQRLLRQAARDTDLFPEPGPVARVGQWVRTAAANSRLLRKPCWLRPSWHRYRRELAAAELRYQPPSSARDVAEVQALLHGEVVGRAVYQSCAECRQALLCKVSAYRDGAGLGTRLIDACVASGGRPGDGYTWYTTPQYNEARGFWRAMSRRHRTPFTDHHGQPRCPHMD
jgi:hypothetical protein